MLSVLKKLKFLKGNIFVKFTKIKKLKYFCENCKLFLCSDCYVVQKTHHNHEIIVIKEKESQISIQIEQSIKNCVKEIKNISSLHVKMNNKREEIVKALNQVKINTNRAFDELIQIININRAEVLKKMDEKNEPNLKTLSKLDSFLKSTRKTIENDSVSLLNHQKDISSAVFSWQSILNTNQNISKLSNQLNDDDISLSNFLLCKVKLPNINMSSISNRIKQNEPFIFKKYEGKEPEFNLSQECLSFNCSTSKFECRIDPILFKQKSIPKENRNDLNYIPTPRKPQGENLDDEHLKILNSLRKMARVSEFKP